MKPTDIPTHSGGQFSLANSAKVWTQFWISTRREGWRSAMTRFRSSHPVRVTYPHGKGSSITALISNPRFYELNMGWPIGWTAPGAPVTGYRAWLQRSRGEFSRLLIAFDQDPDG